MEQVIRAHEIEKEIRNKIEAEYEVIAINGEGAEVTRALWKEAFPEISEAFLDYYFEYRAKDNVTFAIQNDEIISMLHMTPYSTAMRRNPPLPGANRLTCMADVVRVDTALISVAATKKPYRQRGYMKRIMSGALEYQNRMKIPFCFAPADDGAFLEHFGFHYIYDKQEYELNTRIISREMLERAGKGEIIRLNPSHITLSAANKANLLTLAYFVNANLCRKYGLFNIRSAVYYERFQRELQSLGGNLYQIMENDKIKGYFAYAQDNVAEAVFENEFDIDRYFYIAKNTKPAVMARIVNLSEMLKHVSSDGKVSISIRLKDNVMKENDGLFIWYIDRNGSYMERLEIPDNMPAMKPEVTATIGELTAFIFEYIKLKQNMKFDSIYLSGPAWINERY